MVTLYHLEIPLHLSFDCIYMVLQQFIYCLLLDIYIILITYVKKVQQTIVL